MRGKSMAEALAPLRDQRRVASASERCLRIYCAWDEQSQQIVVADMPAHGRTGAT